MICDHSRDELASRLAKIIAAANQANCPTCTQPLPKACGCTCPTCSCTAQATPTVIGRTTIGSGYRPGANMALWPPSIGQAFSGGPGTFGRPTMGA